MKYIFTMILCALFLCCQTYKSGNSNNDIHNDYKEIYNDALRKYNSGLIEEAKDTLDRAIRINSKYTNAYILRALVYDQILQYDNAIVDLKKAIELEPDNYLAYYDLGNAFILNGDLEEAITSFTGSSRNRVGKFLRIIGLAT